MNLAAVYPETQSDLWLLLGDNKSISCI